MVFANSIVDIIRRNPAAKQMLYFQYFYFVFWYILLTCLKNKEKLDLVKLVLAYSEITEYRKPRVLSLMLYVYCSIRKGAFFFSFFRRNVKMNLYRHFILDTCFTLCVISRQCLPWIIRWSSFKLCKD